MSGAKHTPGPWVVTPGLEGNSFTVRAVPTGDDGLIRKPVAEIWHNGDDVEANARLIAAAPELLEALRAFAAVGEIMTAQSPDDKSPWATHDDATQYGSQGLTFGEFRRALAALAKAGAA